MWVSNCLKAMQQWIKIQVFSQQRFVTISLRICAGLLLLSDVEKVKNTVMRFT